MILRNAFAAATFVALLTSPSVFAAAGEVRVEEPSIPSGTDRHWKGALRDAVTQHLSDAHLQSSLHGYSISPALVQLRRYLEPSGKRARVVCIVSLSLRNAQGFVADVRGNASALGGTEPEALDAAAHAAVARLPRLLAAQDGGAQDRGAQVAAR